MRIKRLVIQGFKSFADQVVVDFDEGITGVVGPNGCGKSNIVDALRWAMGEQNAKHLRGGNMQDIIFNGALGRGPMGYAEVNLTFENTDPEKMPEEYKGFTEIEVGRRLYRTGDSEYEINKQQCRLKDITELFLGTGIGTKAYSIIEQGQVSKIISAKPEDRRYMIEEAAGITKYKAKRMAAERRMDATRQNLDRVEDIKGELESRLATLERQAKKAKRFYEIQGELKNLDLHHSTLKYLEHQAQFQHIQRDLSSLSSSITEKQQHQNTHESAVSEERLQLQESERELSALQANQYEVENIIALAKKDLSFINENVQTSQDRTSQISDELTKLHEKQNYLIEDFKKTKTERQTYIDRLRVNEEKLHDEQRLFDEVESKRNSAYSELESKRQEQNQLTSVIAKAQATLEALIKEKAHTQTRNQEILETINNLSNEEKQHIAKSTEITQRLSEKAHSRDVLSSQKDQLKVQADSIKTELEGLTSKRSQIQESLAKAKGKLSSLEDIEKSEANGSGVAKRLQSTSFATQGALSQFLRAPAELEDILESALGKTLQTQIATAGTSLSSMAEEAQKEADGTLSLFVTGMPPSPTLFVAANCEPLLPQLTVDEAHRQTITSLLAKWYLTKNFDTGFSAWDKARAKGVFLLTREGEIFSPDGIIQMGKSDGGSGVLQRRRLIEELTAEVSALTTSLAALEAQLTDSSEQRLKIKTDLSYQMDAVKKLDTAIIHLEAENESLNREQQRFATRKETLVREKDRISARLEQISVEETETEVRLTESQDSLASVKASITENQDELQSIEQNFAKFNASLSSIKAVVGHEQERRDSLDKNIRRIENEQTDNRNRVELLFTQKTDLSDKLVTWAQQKDEANQKIDASSNELEKVMEMLTARRQRHETLAEDLAEKEESISNLRQSLDTEKDRLNTLQLDLKEHEMAIHNIDDRLQEKYETSLFDAINDFHHLEIPEGDLATQVKSMQKSLDNMGKINLNAEEEYEEINGRYTFLAQQGDDLSSALEQLEGAINKINVTTETRFSEAFHAINDSFQKVFPRLFKGGAARLELTDPDDILNSGVEIFAQPPGKKLASIALMSGGEKALTATSLIFAIFLIKPSPFCLLDEVDAPLDETNVDRFSQMVKDMSTRSQFILITHNKRTMEMIDNLYGITMEQAGVSKMVHVQVNEKPEHIGSSEGFAEA